MDISTQFTVRRLTNLTTLLPQTRYTRRYFPSTGFSQQVSPRFDVNAKPTFNPLVKKPVYFLEHEGRTYFSTSYTRFGVLGTEVVFSLPGEHFHDDFTFLVPDFLHGDKELVIENAQPLSQLGIRSLNMVNALRSLLSPFFALLGFFGRVLGWRGLEDSLMILGLVYIYNYYVGLTNFTTCIFGVFFGLNLLVNLFNKTSWFRAIVYFQDYVGRRSNRFEETVVRPYNFYAGHSWLKPQPTAASVQPFSSDGSYDFLSSADSKLHVYALEEKLFHTVDRQSTEVKATKEDYIKAFSDYENGFTQLGLSNWSTVSSIFEKAVESRDSFMFPAFLQHLGLSQDDENFKTCLVNLRRIAGYKRTED